MTMRENIVTGSASKKPGEITGRFVLFALLGFFGVVFAVNGVMIRAATSTFGGVETESSYKAGLAFKNEVAAAHRQDALKWQVSGHVARKGTDATIEIDVKDAQGQPLSSVAIEALLEHPSDARLDRHIAMTQTAPGHFVGASAVAAGQWNLITDISRGGQRVFRSSNRVTLN
jgi:nitrogen fixation protein FixH